MSRTIVRALTAPVGCVIALCLQAQSPPSMSVDEIFARNVATPELQETAFPPHKIAGNVGTNILASFLIVAPDGNILINSSFEDNVPLIEASVEKLGFRFADTKILLGGHAHTDHMEELTGAQTMAMDADVLALPIRSTGFCMMATR